MAVGSGARVKIWLTCDMEVAELGSQGDCAEGGAGLLNEGGMSLWCARSWGRCDIEHGVLIGLGSILHGLELCWGD